MTSTAISAFCNPGFASTAATPVALYPEAGEEDNPTIYPAVPAPSAHTMYLLDAAL